MFPCLATYAESRPALDVLDESVAKALVVQHRAEQRLDLARQLQPGPYVPGPTGSTRTVRAGFFRRGFSCGFIRGRLSIREREHPVDERSVVLAEIVAPRLGPPRQLVDHHPEDHGP